MQQCCAERAPQIQSGVISKVPTVEKLQRLGLAIKKNIKEIKVLVTPLLNK